MSGPLYRRHDALRDDDDDAQGEMTPSERARFVDAARRQAARHDRAIVEAGRRLLARYGATSTSPSEAFRRFAEHLFGVRGGS